MNEIYWQEILQEYCELSPALKVSQQKLREFVPVEAYCITRFGLDDHCRWFVSSDSNLTKDSVFDHRDVINVPIPVLSKAVFSSCQILTRENLSCLYPDWDQNRIQEQLKTDQKLGYGIGVSLLLRQKNELYQITFYPKRTIPEHTHLLYQQQHILFQFSYYALSILGEKLKNLPKVIAKQNAKAQADFNHYQESFAINRFYLPSGGYLTSREIDAGKLLVKNLSVEEIASILKISRRTVEDHIARICDKLGGLSKRQLPAALLELGFKNIIRYD